MSTARRRTRRSSTSGRSTRSSLRVQSASSTTAEREQAERRRRRPAPVRRPSRARAGARAHRRRSARRRRRRASLGRRPAGRRARDEGRERRPSALAERAEPERRRDVEVLGDAARDRVAEADPGRGRRPTAIAIVVVALSRGRWSRADAIVSGISASPRPCIARPATSSGSAGRARARRAAGGDSGEADEQHGAAVRAVAEAAEQRRGDGADQQRRGQRPLGRAQARVQVARDRRDQRRAERADHRDDEADADQRGHVAAGARPSRRGRAARRWWGDATWGRSRTGMRHSGTRYGMTSGTCIPRSSHRRQAWSTLRPDAKRERLLAAAERVFAERGLDAPMPAIARAAGPASGASIGSSRPRTSSSPRSPSGAWPTLQAALDDALAAATPGQACGDLGRVPSRGDKVLR